MSDLQFELIKFELLKIQMALAFLEAIHTRLTGVENRLATIESKLLMVNIINATQGSTIGQAAAGSENSQEHTEKEFGS